MHEILCSTGAMVGRPNGRNYRLLETCCPQLRCDGIEFILYNTWYDQVKEITRYLKGLHLHIPVMHCEKTLSEHITRGGKEELEEAFRLFRINCAMAEEIGANRLVLHLWNGVISDSCMENNLRAYPELKKISEEYHLDLLVENVVCHIDPMTHWMELYRLYPDIHFVFDTKMAQFHRQMELLYSQEYAFLWKDGHIRHYHVNDHGGAYMDWNNLKVLPVGTGLIDFDRFFSFVHQTGYSGDFTLEATGFDAQGEVHIDLLNRQFDKVREYIWKTGGAI